jgi:hypothetical protein
MSKGHTSGAGPWRLRERRRRRGQQGQGRGQGQARQEDDEEEAEEGGERGQGLGQEEAQAQGCAASPRRLYDACLMMRRARYLLATAPQYCCNESASRWLAPWPLVPAPLALELALD